MRRPSGEHYLLFAAFLLAILAQLKASGDGWHHATTIDFWIFTVTQLGLFLRGIYTDKPAHQGE